MRHYTRTSSKNRQRGQMGIIGVLLGLAITALVLYFVISHFTDAKSSQGSQASTGNLVQMISNTQKTYNSISTGYTGVTAGTLVQNGDVPSQMVNGNTINSPFGTPVTVGAATLYTAGDGVSFTMQVPPGQCAEFASAMASNVARLTVAGTTIKDTTAGTNLSPTTLGTACSGTAGAQVPVVLIATR